MNLYDGKAKLSYAAKKLRLHWQEAQTEWSDAVSRDFEATYLAPLEPQLAATAQALDRLSEVLMRAQQECGNDR
ncbi:MAG: hypothetical protein HYX69_15545 [Planctomycetia bacterium]|nr:hypothetical protein [Planctomycetia bacterium]